MPEDTLKPVPQNAVRHIVMWDVSGDTQAEKMATIEEVKQAFESLRGHIPGMLHLEVGIDDSTVDYACDMVLFTEFESQAALAAYATHPKHLAVRDALIGKRIARHQVDYDITLDTKGPTS